MANIDVHTETIMTEKCSKCQASVRNEVFIIEITRCYLNHPEDRASYVARDALVNCTRKVCEDCWKKISLFMSSTDLK